MNEFIYPGAEEICNGVDDDCDGDIDEDVQQLFFEDADGDGQGNAAIDSMACEAPTGFVSNETDCDDGDETIYLGAPELCDDKDNDCNGEIDDDVVISTFYFDGDMDGFGLESITKDSCALPSGYALVAGDCDDSNEFVNPGAEEVCNDVDDNCDGEIDEGLLTVYYADGDMDGFGDPDNFTEACMIPPGFTENSMDCDDMDETIYPDAPELCDDKDNDCDGNVDEDAIESIQILQNDTLLTVEITGGTGPFSYEWNTGSMDTSIVSETGEIIVAITDVNGCVASDTLIISSIELVETNLIHRIYPNPVRNILNIEFIDVQQKDVTITIRNTSGKQVYISKKSVERIDMNEWDAGLYFIQISSSKGTQVLPIVKLD
jgi:hypothetical protein